MADPHAAARERYAPLRARQARPRAADGALEPVSRRRRRCARARGEADAARIFAFSGSAHGCSLATALLHSQPQLLRANPVAPWELRIGDLRVYFDVEQVPERHRHNSCRWPQTSGEGAHSRRGGRPHMKTIEVADATAPLAEYARANRRGALLLTVRGRPYAALMPISTPTDLENLRVSNSPAFQALIAESRRVNPPGTGTVHDAGSASARWAAVTSEGLDLPRATLPSDGESRIR